MFSHKSPLLCSNFPFNALCWNAKNGLYAKVLQARVWTNMQGLSKGMSNYKNSLLICSPVADSRKVKEAVRKLAFEGQVENRNCNCSSIK